MFVFGFLVIFETVGVVELDREKVGRVTKSFY